MEYAATVEIVERHFPGYGPDQSSGSPVIVPNLLRINGDDVWSAGDHPVEVGPITLTLGSAAVVIPITCLVRYVDGAEEAPVDGPPAATLMVAEESVILNGKIVSVEPGGVEPLHYHLGTRYARVRIPLYASRVVVCAEPSEQAAPSIHPYSGPSGVIYPSVADAEAILTMAKVRVSALTGSRPEPSNVELRAASDRLHSVHSR
jgi:hypothetical protein